MGTACSGRWRLGTFQRAWRVPRADLKSRSSASAARPSVRLPLRSMPTAHACVPEHIRAVFSGGKFMSAAKTVKKRKGGKAAAGAGKGAGTRRAAAGGKSARVSANGARKSAGKSAKAPAGYKEPGLLKRLAEGPVICAEGYV